MSELSEETPITPYAAYLGKGVYMSASSILSRLLHVGRRRAGRTLSDVWAENIQTVRDSDPYYLTDDLSDSLQIDIVCDTESRLFTDQLVQAGLYRP